MLFLTVNNKINMIRYLIKPATTNICNHNLLYIKRYLRLAVLHLAQENHQTAKDRYMTKMNEILAKYNTEQEAKILNIINNSNFQDLVNYKISNGSAKNLLLMRKRKGSLENLIDIFDVKGFGLRITEKFLESIFEPARTNEVKLKQPQRKMTSFITPNIGEKQRHEIKSTVSVRVGVKSITWARLDVPPLNANAACELTHWEHLKLSDKKLLLNELIQLCFHINSCIPHADCYLFESPPTVQATNNPGSVEQQNINIETAQLTAIMGYALAIRNSTLNEVTDLESDDKLNYYPNLFYVKRFLTARLFNHLVGNEPVSSENIIMDMMRTFYNTDDSGLDDIQNLEDNSNISRLDDIKHSADNANLSGCIQFSTELRQMFSDANAFGRDSLSQTLLLNLAFVRLVLLQDSKSISIVSRHNKQQSVLNN